MFKLSQIIPNGPFKNKLKARYREYIQKSLIMEVNKVTFLELGICSIDSENVAFTTLPDGTKLYGHQSSDQEIELYRYWHKHLKSQVSENTFGLAMGVVTRYYYPHSMPSLKPPYPRWRRRSFHLQHIETIDDFSRISSREKKELKQKFTPNIGETVMDIGAYLGFGSIWMSKKVGHKGTIVAVEPDPVALKLLKLNIQNNNLYNVIIVPKAIWNTTNDSLSFYKAGHQANSLVEDIVDPHSITSVQTITIDSIQREYLNLPVDFINLTVNGAEVEAVEAMKETVNTDRPIRLSITGWYRRDGQLIAEIIKPMLQKYNLSLAIGQAGRVLAWR